MPLPTCECVKGLPIGEQLAAIYCATYTLAAGDVDGPYLLKSANLSDVADADAARGNISAAESGANTDITSLGGVLNIGVGGATPTAATYPKVIAYPSANFLLTSGGTLDTITPWTETLDTASAFNAATGQFTVPTNAAGVYEITFTPLFFAGGATSNIGGFVFVNGGYGQRLFATGSVNSNLTRGGVAHIQLAAGDVVTLVIQQEDGAAWTVAGANAISSILFIGRIF